MLRQFHPVGHNKLKPASFNLQTEDTLSVRRMASIDRVSVP
jgi:hypothetical protein